MNYGRWFGKQTHTIVHKVNGGERWKLFTFYSKIMEFLLRNQLNYKQNIFIIKKRIDSPPPKTTQMEEFSADFWSRMRQPYFSLKAFFFY